MKNEQMDKALKSILEANLQMSEDVKRTFYQPLQELIKYQTEQTKIFLKSISPISDLFKNTKLDISLPLIEGITKNLKAMQDFSKAAEKIINLTKAVKNDEDYKKFPFLMAGYLPCDFFDELTNLWLKNKQEVKDKLYEATSDIELQKDLIKELKEHEYFREREVIVRDALEAHSNKKFSLSIPVLYSLIDGAFIETFKDQIKVESLKCQKCNKEYTCPDCGAIYNSSLNAKGISRKLKNKDEFKDDFLDLCGVVDFINATYHSHRSKIHHGLDFGYASDRDLSTVLVMALSSVEYILREKERQNKQQTLN